MNFYKNYHIVAFHRNIGTDFDAGNKLIKDINNLGVITICDIDDYWLPTKEHPVHDIIKLHKIDKKIIFLENICIIYPLKKYSYVIFLKSYFKWLEYVGR